MLKKPSGLFFIPPLGDIHGIYFWYNVNMNEVTLIGKSHKGKDRVKRFGEVWQVLEIGSFDGTPSMLLRSKEKTDRGSTRNFRWVALENDKDFDVLD